MIVKINRWKKGEFNKILSYIDSDKGRSKGVNAIFHNITVPTIEGALSEFRENDVYRRKRKGGVVIYHEILSFHEKDSQFLSLEILEDIARKYISLRGENALCFAKPHIEDKHFHIHFAFSGTECFSSKTLRLDNKAFRRIKRDIEKYQIEKYPELSNSIVYHKKKSRKKKKSDKEHQLKKRTQRDSDKDFLVSELSTHFKGCTGFDSFVELLKKDGFHCYEYRGKVNGVLYNGRKYRFSSLGFGKERFDDLEKRISVLQNYRSVLKKKQLENEFKARYKARVFLSRDEIGDLISSRSFNVVLRKKELRKLQKKQLFRNMSR